MGPDDSNFPEEIPAIPEAGQASPGPLRPPTPGEDRAPEPEMGRDSPRAMAQPDPGAAARPDQPAPPPPRLADPPPEAANWVEAEPPYQPQPLNTLDEILIVLAEGVARWRRGLRWVRSQLPAGWRAQLSDPVLTAILLGLGVVLLVTTHPLGSRSSPAQVPPPPAPVGEVIAVGEPAAIATPPPSPEASLIADLEAQLSPITRRYTAGLIDAVEVNLPSHSLTIHLGESWYGLLAPQQDSIAQEIYDQARGLGLDRLTLEDPAQLMVARSPVVGSTMVVLQRRRPSPDVPSA